MQVRRHEVGTPFETGKGLTLGSRLREADMHAGGAVCAGDLRAETAVLLLPLNAGH